MYPKELKYSKSHEWVRVEGNRATIGITDYAQKELGDVVFVELPKVGANLKAGETFGEVESVKAVSDLYSPLSGTVLAINSGIVSKPELVNKDPYGEGWMLVVTISDPSELNSLLSAEEYEAFISKKE